MEWDARHTTLRSQCGRIGGFLFHFFFLADPGGAGTTLLLFLPFFSDHLPPTRNGEHPKIE